MAEVLGVLASGISVGTLAAQIVNSVTKLKSYWDEIKEAPEDIKLLIEEIEDLQLLLTDMEEDQRRNPMSSMILDSSSASKCLSLCKRGADTLKQLVEDLGADIEAPARLKRKWASAKVVLKKDKIEKYKSRLGSAIRLLSLSHQYYTTALVRSQPDIIVARLSCAIGSLQSSNAVITGNVKASITDTSKAVDQTTLALSSALDTQVSISKVAHAYEIRTRQRKRREQFTARGRISLLLINKAWEFNVSRSMSGWTCNLRVYSVVPRGSAAHMCAIHDDVKGLRDLFDRRLASPLDVIDMTGLSLLQTATVRSSFQVCRYLLECGADPNEANGSKSAVWHLTVNARCLKENTPAALEAFRLFLDVYGGELDADMLSLFRGPLEAFVSLQRYLPVRYSDLSLEDQAEIAIGVLIMNNDHGHTLFRSALPPGPIPPTAITYKTEDGETLLGGLALALGNMDEFNGLIEGTDFSQEMQDLRADIRELVDGGADVLAAGSLWVESWTATLTPLLCMIVSSILHYHREPRPRSFRRTRISLEIWLEDLNSSGIDLLEYGRREKLMYDQLAMSGPFWRFETGIEYRLSSFVFGACPSDWFIEVEETVDGPSFLGDFWSSVEEREPEEKAIPGMWVE